MIKSILSTNHIIYILFLGPFLLSELMAGNCCGGGASLPSIILADQRAQVSISYARKKVIGNDPYARGDYIFKSDERQEQRHSYQLKAAYAFNESFQVATDLSLQSNTIDSNTETLSRKTDIGDSALTFSYEFLPELGYSQWKPRGFVYMKTIFPIGNGSFTANSPLEVTGTGHWQNALGFAFAKTFARHDASIFIEVANRYRKKYNGVEYNPAPAYKLLFDVGRSVTSTLRLGASLAYNFQTSYLIDKRRIPNSYHWDFSISLSHDLGDDYSLGLNYMDQTVFGPAKLDQLSRSITFLFKKGLPF